MDLATVHQTLKHVIAVFLLAAVLIFFFPSIAPFALSLYFVAMAVQVQGAYDGPLKNALIAIFCINAFFILF